MTSNMVMSASRVLFVWHVLVCIAAVARAQTSTASLFPVAFQNFGLEGEVRGTGADGTTYVLSGIDSVTVTGITTEALPFTMTLVEDASHVSEIAVVSEQTMSFSVNVQCGIESGLAVCTETVSEAGQATQLTQSGSVSFIPVPVVTGKVTITTLPPSLTSVPTATSTQPPQMTITNISQSAPSSTTSAAPSAAAPRLLGYAAQMWTATLGVAVALVFMIL